MFVDGLKLIMLHLAMQWSYHRIMRSASELIVTLSAFGLQVRIFRADCRISPCLAVLVGMTSHSSLKSNQWSCASLQAGNEQLLGAKAEPKETPSNLRLKELQEKREARIQHAYTGWVVISFVGLALFLVLCIHRSYHNICHIGMVIIVHGINIHEYIYNHLHMADLSTSIGFFYLQSIHVTFI